MTPCKHCQREKTWTYMGKCTACGGIKDDTVKIQNGDYTSLMERLAKYEKALEFYATAQRSSLHEDGGAIARKELNS